MLVLYLLLLHEAGVSLFAGSRWKWSVLLVFFFDPSGTAQGLECLPIHLWRRWREQTRKRSPGRKCCNHMMQSSTPCFNYKYPFQHSAFHVYLFLNRFLINLFLICLFSKVHCCVSFSATCAVSGGISMRYRKVLRMAEGSGAWLQIVKSKWNCPMKVPLQEVHLMCSWVCFDITGLYRIHGLTDLPSIWNSMNCLSVSAGYKGVILWPACAGKACDNNNRQG